MTAPDRSQWTDAEISFAQKIEQLEGELRETRDGIHTADLMDLQCAVLLLTIQLTSALTKLGQPKCSECGGDADHYLRDYGKKCGECLTTGREWV